jgi:hypothetical protein
MSDIFISYAKTDHALALRLSAFLEAEGWTVWWDKSLGVADLYRDEIMKQLAAARAVITIWSPNSIRSDWVRAEAGAAKAQAKLIPVKTPDVAYADIPLPFGEMHTENVGSNDLIRAAVVAQLAKPAVEPTALSLLTKGFRYELLTWVGIVGGALTLFTNLGAVLKLADWARVLVQHWHEWTHAFWVWAFGWLGFYLEPDWPPVLSFLSFGSMLTVGQAIQFKRTIKTKPIVDEHHGNSFDLISWRTFGYVVCTLIFKAWWTRYSAVTDVKLLYFLIHIFPTLSIQFVMNLPVFVVTIANLIIFARHRLPAAVVALLMGIFWTIITFGPPKGITEKYGQLGPPITVYEEGFEQMVVEFIADAMLLVLPVILLSVAPAKAVTRRLIC